MFIRTGIMGLAHHYDDNWLILTISEFLSREPDLKNCNIYIDNKYVDPTDYDTALMKDQTVFFKQVVGD